MKDEEQFFHWLEVPDNAPILFGDLPRLLADARHPDRVSDHDYMEAGASRVNYEIELPQAVREGRLVVRDALTGARQSSPIGAALKRAVVFPLQDLRPFLAELGMGVRIREKPPESQPVQRGKSIQTQQEEAILNKLREMGYDPLALPRPPDGKPGVKAAVKKALGNQGMWVGPSVFKKAWEERLSRDGRIKYVD